MAGREKAPLTKLELQIMQVIWRRGTSSVSEVLETLEQELAYTTVQTMLNILCRKGTAPQLVTDPETQNPSKQIPVHVKYVKILHKQPHIPCKPRLPAT